MMVNPIALQNDSFRQIAGIASHPTLTGLVHITKGVSVLPIEKQNQILKTIREFEAFAEDTDPYNEHEFGEFGDYCFKIDCFNNDELECDSDDPTDPTKTFRVLTVMRFDDY